MNWTAGMNHILWVAAGGALGAGAHYLAVVLLAPRIGWWRTVFALTVTASAALGVIVSMGRFGNLYGFVGIGFLGALAPFTALTYSTFDSSREVLSRRSISLIAWTLLAGVAMAILGYISADAGRILFEKIPSRV